MPFNSAQVHAVWAPIALTPIDSDDSGPGQPQRVKPVLGGKTQQIVHPTAPLDMDLQCTSDVFESGPGTESLSSCQSIPPAAAALTGGSPVVDAVTGLGWEDHVHMHMRICVNVQMLMRMFRDIHLHSHLDRKDLYIDR